MFESEILVNFSHLLVPCLAVRPFKRPFLGVAAVIYRDFESNLREFKIIQQAKFHNKTRDYLYSLFLFLAENVNISPHFY